MKKLRTFDLEELKLKAGSGDGPVTVSREDFDALVDGYISEMEEVSYDCCICDAANIVTFKRKR